MNSWGKVVARNGLRLRSSPRDGEILTVLPRGTAVRILEREVWLRIQVAGREGFVLADWIENDGKMAEREGSNSLASLVAYSNTHFEGEITRIDKDFRPVLDQLNTQAKLTGLKIWVTSSFRRMAEPVTGAVVPPALHSNHLVGHAIDMNLDLNGRLYNSEELKVENEKKLPDEIQAFLSWVKNEGKEEGLRWGGLFNPEDPVHIDDGLNWSNRPLWEQKFRVLQAGT